MLPALHALCMVVAVPYVVLAAGFALLGYAIQLRSLWDLVDTLLATAAWLVSWGGLVVGAIYLAIIALPFFPPTRLVGVIVGTAVCVVSIVTILALSATRLTAGQWLSLAPCIAALAVESRLVFHARHVATPP